MKSYYGKTKFIFEIERYKNKNTGVIMPHDSAGHLIDRDPLSFQYELIKLDIKGGASYCPGNLQGLPENCFPDDFEVEIESVVGSDGKDWADLLTKNEVQSIINIIEDHVCDREDPNDEYEPDDYEDSGSFNYDY